MRISMVQFTLLFILFLLFFNSNSQIVKNFRELIKQLIKYISKQ